MRISPHHQKSQGFFYPIISPFLFESLCFLQMYLAEKLERIFPELFLKIFTLKNHDENFILKKIIKIVFVS